MNIEIFIWAIITLFTDYSFDLPLYVKPLESALKWYM